MRQQRIRAVWERVFLGPVLKRDYLQGEWATGWGFSQGGERQESLYVKKYGSPSTRKGGISKVEPFSEAKKGREARACPGASGEVADGFGNGQNRSVGKEEKRKSHKARGSAKYNVLEAWLGQAGKNVPLRQNNKLVKKNRGLTGWEGKGRLAAVKRAWLLCSHFRN